MFDWNDEELTNIIWDEAGEGDNHIVLYTDQIEEKPPILFGDPTENDINQGTTNVSPIESKKSSIKFEHGVELDINSKFDHGDPGTEFGLGSWPDKLDQSVSHATEADSDSMGTAASNNLTKNSNNDSLRADEMIQFDKDSEIFQNLPEDREEGDFVDYGWANIGSFDDLDRIFSNRDPIFGDKIVGNADELWSSSKDVTTSPLGPTPLPGDSSDLALRAPSTSSDRSEIRAQYMLDPSQSFTSGDDKLNEITSHTPEDVQASIDASEHSGGKSKLLVKEKTFEMGGNIQACHKQPDDGTATTLNEYPDKGNLRRRLLKGKKLDKKTEVRQLHDLRFTLSSFGSPFQQVNSQYAPSLVNPCPPFVLTQQRQLQRPGSLQQNHFPHPFTASPLNGNVVNHYPAISVSAQFHPGDGNRELVSSDYEVTPGKANSLKKSIDVSEKPPAMTPQEKIEKLRRKQQMRAIDAIHKQQHQFGNQVAVSEHSNMEGRNVEVDESLSIFPSLDSNSPIEHDDSNTISMAFDNCSVQESILYWLQDAIAKLELQIRLCIRDSLFRLAQSAMQRQYPIDTSSTNTGSRDNVLGNKEIYNHERFTRMPHVETDTNPIDRTVAHLLFHNPLEFSGKPAEMPESPLSASLPYKCKGDSLKNLAKDSFDDSSENTYMTSSQGSKTHGLFSQGNQSKNSSCLDTSENASNNAAADGGATRVEALT